MFDRKQYMKKYYAEYRKKNIDKLKAFIIEYKKKNQEIIKAARRPYRENNESKIKKQVRENKFKTRYGITTAEYNLICASQDFCCAICGKPIQYDKPLNVDHNHKTGKIRGLLCGNCNSGIGLFKDDKSIIINAFNYLKEYEQRITS